MASFTKTTPRVGFRWCKAHFSVTLTASSTVLNIAFRGATVASIMVSRMGEEFKMVTVWKALLDSSVVSLVVEL